MLCRIPSEIRRHFSVNAILRVPESGDDPGTSRLRGKGRPRLERDRIKHPETRPGPVGRQNEDFFGEMDRGFRRRPQYHRPDYKRERREQFRQLLEAEAGTDEVAEEFKRHPPPDSGLVGDHLHDVVRRQRRIMKREMEQRKYYNFPIEDNLLTWKAKEQIFQLRKTDPETWTPDRIAESFPISTEGVRRLLKRKWPPDLSGEDVEEVIRKHDDEVRRRWVLLKKGKPEEGLLSELTLNMIRSGQVKFLPMFAAGNTKLAEDSAPKVEEFSPEIMPGDGPFVKLYKRHLQFLEKTSVASADPTASREGASDGKEGQALVHSSDQGAPEKNSEELLRSFVFPEDEPGTEGIPVQFEQFRHQLERALRRRNRPQDRKYREWMADKAKKTEAGSSG